MSLEENTNASLNEVAEPIPATPVLDEKKTDAPIQRADAPAPSIAPEMTPSLRSPVYVAGKLRVVFPNKGLEKECEAAAQEISAKRGVTVAPYQYGTIFGFIDCRKGCKEKSNGRCQCPKPYRYLAENANWILSVDEQDAYVIEPSSIVELNEFIYYLKELEKRQDNNEELLSVVVGENVGYKPSGDNFNASLPVINCKHVFDFDPSPQAIEAKLGSDNTTTKAISNLLNLLKVKQSLGDTDIERAKNFLAFRYPDIYHTRSSEQSGSGYSSTNNDNTAFLLSIDTEHSSSASEGKIVDVIFHYQKAVSGRQFSYYASVDVSGLFPFLHSPLNDYIPSNK